MTNIEKLPKLLQRKETILIRVDASHRMGSGHVMRCLTLAESLKNQNQRVIFISKKHKGNLNHLIQSKGFELFELPPPLLNTDIEDQSQWLGCSITQDLEDTLQAVAHLQIELLIVDHYAIERSWHAEFRKHIQEKSNLENICSNLKIMVIDDLANRPHDCDLLLDQTLGRQAKDYQHLLPPHCQCLMGKNYIMLREEFLTKHELVKKARETDFPIEKVLISLGGSDPNNISEQLLLWLIQFSSSAKPRVNLQVNLVISESSPHFQALTELSCAHSWIKIIVNPKSMAELMLKAKLAIGASGTTAWERCFLGLPCLSIVTANNQILVDQSLAKHGATLSLGTYQNLTYTLLEESLIEILNSNNKYQNMVASCLNCFDGLGTKRVTYALLNQTSQLVSLKKADIGDRDIVFNWQSDEQVRQFFRNPSTVSKDEHYQWFNKALSSTTQHLYMIMLILEDLSTRPVGTLRLDKLGLDKTGLDKIGLDKISNKKNVSNANWEISILIDPTYQGKQLASQAIKKLDSSYKAEGIIAEVHPDNLASHKLFKQVGFKPIADNMYLLNSQPEQVSYV